MFLGKKVSASSAPFVQSYAKCAEYQRKIDVLRDFSEIFFFYSRKMQKADITLQFYYLNIHKYEKTIDVITLLVITLLVIRLFRIFAFE